MPYITEEMFPLLRELVDDVVLVEEPAIRRSMRALVLDNKLVVEASGAITVAAALEVRQERASDGDRLVCVLSGGSVDGQVLAELLEGS